MVFKIEADGAKKITELFTSSSHQTQLHSLNLSNNNIDVTGTEALISLLGSTSLTGLHMQNQQKTYEEQDVDMLTEAIAKALSMIFDY